MIWLSRPYIAKTSTEVIQVTQSPLSVTESKISFSLFSQTEHPWQWRSRRKSSSRTAQLLFSVALKKTGPAIPMSETACHIVYFYMRNSTTINVLAFSVAHIWIFYLLMPSCQTMIQVVYILAGQWCTLSTELFFCINFLFYMCSVTGIHLFWLSL
jgi:hypothetical protein